MVPACQDHPLSPPDRATSRTEVKLVPINSSNKLDVIFMIDNSDSMAAKQANLTRNFPQFMQQLKMSSSSALDVHIAVISSDLGAGPQALIDSCRPGGDNGAFQHTARGKGGTCTAVPRGSFISSGPDGNNFDGAIEDVFSCIAELGFSGCGFEHQLASLRRALGGDPTAPMPAENAGFLRADARLGVVIITDEDDCSAPPDTDLFTGLTDTLTSHYGAFESYRCNEFGHLCDGNPPLRQAGVVLQNCTSNETASSKLLKVGDMVSFLRGLKPDPNDLVVATITGLPTSYETQLSAPNELSFANERYIQVKPSCSSPPGSMNGTADPAVRLAQFTQAFKDKGLLRSICVDQLADVMKEIAISIAPDATLCVSGRLLDMDSAKAGVQADCVVTEVSTTGGEPITQTAIPACDENGVKPPCWTIETNLTKCPPTMSPQSLQVTVNWGAGAPAGSGDLQYQCAVCAGASDPHCTTP
ncbi:MAG TPA: vWA domain-containing protein [Polyangia bacterium]